MGEHLRLAGAEMGARDLIVLWGLGFSSTSRHTKKRRVNASRLPVLCADQVMTFYSAIAPSKLLPECCRQSSNFQLCPLYHTRKARLDPYPLVKKGKVRCVIYAPSHCPSTCRSLLPSKTDNEPCRLIPSPFAIRPFEVCLVS
jgi:hypothetical protein